MEYTFHWRPVFDALPELLSAALLTLEVSFLSIIIGILLGLFLAIAKDRGAWPLKALANVWIEIARNTPALFQLFFFGFGISAVMWDFSWLGIEPFRINLSPYTIVLLGLSFNNAGYLAETFRGGFKAVPETQLKAARSLGMTATQSYTRILSPQVMRIVYFPMTNQLVWAVLMSSLGMMVGFRELTGETQFFASKTFRIFEYFAVTAVLYYIIVKFILAVAHVIAWRAFRWAK